MAILPEMVPVRVLVTLAVSAAMAMPPVPVAEIVPSLLWMFAVTAKMPVTPPVMTPERALSTVAVVAAIAMPLVPVASILLALAMTLTVPAEIAMPFVPVAEIVPSLLWMFAVLA